MGSKISISQPQPKKRCQSRKTRDQQRQQIKGRKTQPRRSKNLGEKIEALTLQLKGVRDGEQQQRRQERQQTMVRVLTLKDNKSLEMEKMVGRDESETPLASKTVKIAGGLGA
ncbi:hypothetical protein K1719_029770 [Acacia pycnantha]|nr:hypothetical protein K1719_029770 [Acacia pycnantha]